MSLVPIRVDRTSKPPVGTPLRSDGHWSVQKIGGAVALNELGGTGIIESVSNARSDVWNGVWGTTGVRVASASAQSPQWTNKQFVRTSNQDGTGDFSILFIGSPVPSAGITYCGGQRDGSSPYKQIIFIANSTSSATISIGAIAAGFYDGTWRLVSVPYALDGKKHTFMLVRRGSEISLSIDGALRASDIKNTSSVYSTTQSVAICGNPEYLSAADTSEQCLWLYYNRALSQSEIASLSDSPWQIYEPETVWIEVGGGGEFIGVYAAIQAAQSQGLSASLDFNGYSVQSQPLQSEIINTLLQFSGGTAQVQARQLQAASDFVAKINAILRVTASDPLALRISVRDPLALKVTVH